MSSDIFSLQQSYSPTKGEPETIKRVTLVWESTFPDHALEFMPVQPRNYGVKTRSKATAAERMDGEEINVSQATTTAPQVQTVSGTTTSAASTSTAPTTTASSHVPFVNIQPFDEKRMSAAQWWLLFVQYCGLYSLTETQMIQRLPFNLTEKAQQWFLRFSEDVKGILDTLKNAFIDRFDQKWESLSAGKCTVKNRRDPPAPRIPEIRKRRVIRHPPRSASGEKLFKLY